MLVTLPQVGHEDVRVPAAGDDLGEGLVGLESPDTLLMTRVRGDAPLLAQGPELDRAVTGAAETLGPVPVEHQRLHVVAVTLELHQLPARSRIPDPQHLLRATGHDDGAGGVHGQAVDAVLVPVEAARGHGVVAGSQRGQGVHVPQEDGLVQPGAGHLLPVLGVGQGLDVVLVGAQRGHAEPLVGVPHLDRGVAAG